MMGSDMRSCFSEARLTRRKLLHFSVSVALLLATGVAEASDASTGRLVLVVGDSISAEYGLAQGSGWVALMGERLAAQKLGYGVVNASISGDTTAGGLARLPALLKRKPAVVILELGGNDALRGLPLAESRRNLKAMVEQSRVAGARVLIAGIEVPPNYGRQYTQEFARMYADVAAAHKLPLVPSVLKGIVDRPDADDWFQADRIHPIARAHPIILDNVWPALRPLLDR